MGIRNREASLAVTQGWEVGEGLPGASDAGDNSEGQELHQPDYTSRGMSVSCTIYVCMCMREI